MGRRIDLVVDRFADAEHMFGMWHPNASSVIRCLCFMRPRRLGLIRRGGVECQTLTVIKSIPLRNVISQIITPAALRLAAKDKRRQDSAGPRTARQSAAGRWASARAGRNVGQPVAMTTHFFVQFSLCSEWALAPPGQGKRGMLNGSALPVRPSVLSLSLTLPTVWFAGEMIGRTRAGGEVMNKYFSSLLLAAFVLGCGGASTAPAPRTTAQHEANSPQPGDPCEVDDGVDSCLPDQTGLTCCTVGPGYYGFCIAGPDICV